MKSELEKFLSKFQCRVEHLKKIEYKSGTFNVYDIEKLLKIVGVMKKTLKNECYYEPDCDCDLCKALHEADKIAGGA